MLTADQVSDRCSGNNRPTVQEIADHFRDTIFWNWADGIKNGLSDQSRIDCEFPLSVTDRPEVEGIDRVLRFESGECCIAVATIHESDSDETATKHDAHFVANLPVYMPVLFGALEAVVTACEPAIVWGEKYNPVDDPTVVIELTQQEFAALKDAVAKARTELPELTEGMKARIESMPNDLVAKLWNADKRGE